MAIPRYFNPFTNEPASADYLYQFASKYKVQSVNVEQDIDSYSSYRHSATHYDRDNAVVSVRLPLRAYKHLAECDQRGEVVNEERYQESRLRQKYPALQKAYEEYQLLLELMRE